MFGKERRQALGGCGAAAAVGDEAGDEAGGGDVEGGIGGGAGLRRDADGDDGAVGGAAGHVGDLGRVALLDGDVADAVGDGPVDGGGGDGDPERHAVVLGGQGLEVGADLVGGVAGGADAVGADDGEVHVAVLHQVASGIVGDHGVRHAV